jgi:type IV pilus secretin PilQ/predicted competence protein
MKRSGKSFAGARLAMFCGWAAVAALGVLTPLAARGIGADMATLRKVGSRLDGRAGFVTIEASDPVPYVASQPDPRTFVVELRDVIAGGVPAQITTAKLHPVESVRVEQGRALDGASVTRISMTLTHAMRPRVRSARNIITVEADRAEDGITGAPAIGLAGPSAVIRDIRVVRRGQATAVTLVGTARLSATSVSEPKEGPRRVVLDFTNTTSAVTSAMTVGQGPVARVRIGLSPRSPLMTQVSMDLSRAATYRVESSPNGQDLTVVFDDQVNPLESLRPTAVGAPVRPSQSAGPGFPVPAPSRVESATPALQAAAAPSAAAQAAPPSAQAVSAAAAQAAPVADLVVPTPRYTGHAVSLDFQGADLRAVLRTFAEISGLNVVIDPTIQGSVDVALRDVPWDQALDIILRANRLGYAVDGTIVRVAPLTVLADEESQRRKLQEEQALAGELRVYTRALSYAKAEDLKPLLTSTALSQRGSVQTDVRTNTIIINDLPDRIERAAALLTTLDVPQPQVEIEARIVQTNRSFASRLGVQWGMGGRASPALGNTAPLAFPNQGSLTGRTGLSQGAPGDTAGTVGNLVNLGVAGATSAVGLALGSVNGALNLDLALSALESSGQGRILSTPRVSTQNNVEAEITQGVQIPIQTVANNTVTVSFRDAALTLKVTPQITAAGTVIMRISVANEAPDFSRSVNNIPPIDTQRAVTQVLVSDGETTVIGGIYVSREQATQDRTPGLYRLPLLGWLFKRNLAEDESRELLIFITPKIVKL